MADLAELKGLTPILAVVRLVSDAHCLLGVSLFDVTWPLGYHFLQRRNYAVKDLGNIELRQLGGEQDAAAAEAAQCGFQSRSVIKKKG
ncbi:MAG: hypothetical protein JNK87_12115 [Bryobacterales bacterium]|nr:hypothetical protein [Bryobacterales bacterium]